MPFSTEITSIKAEIASGLAASQYTAKDLVYVSKAIEALSNAETQAGTFNEAIVNTILYVGSTAQNFETGATLTNPIAVFEADETDFAQIAFRNKGTAVSSSTDVILYSNNGDDNHGWIDMGITSSNFADPSFTITGKGDGYIFMSGATGGVDTGNLVLATDDTGSQNKIIFAAGGLASDNTQMVITPDENIHIEIPTPSTSPSTGALTVVGGVGIQGDVNIQGDITFGGSGTTLTTTTLTVTDPVVRVGSGNTSDAVDLGIVGEYQVGGVTKYTGVVRDATDGIIKFYKDTTVAPVNGVVNFSGAGLAYSDIKVNGIEAASANITSATIGSVTNTEIGYLSGVTSAIQTQISAKSPSNSPTFTGTVTLPTQTSIGDIDANEIGYLNGVSSNIQTQLDAKLASATAASTYAPLASPTFTGTASFTGATVTGIYPTQTGNSGRYLTTDGSVVSWAVVDALPSQSGNSGKYLTTNGTSASWSTITTDPLPDVFMMMGA